MTSHHPGKGQRDEDGQMNVTCSCGAEFVAATRFAVDQAFRNHAHEERWERRGKWRGGGPESGDKRPVDPGEPVPLHRMALRKDDQ